MNTSHLSGPDARTTPSPKTDQMSHCCFAADSTELLISVCCTMLKVPIIATTMMISNHVNIFLSSKKEF